MIRITEVGPRDGLQNEARSLSTAQKVEFIRGCVAAGLPRIEVASFVNPKVVPQMADAEAVIAGLPQGSTAQYAGLVLNARGLERALATDLEVVHCTLAVSDAFNQRNAGRSTAASLEELTDGVRGAGGAKTFVAVLGTAFGCPYQGEVPVDQVLAIAERFLEAGCEELTLADTTGLATPRTVRELVAGVQASFGAGVPLGLHFHNTRGLGLSNAFAGYLAGVTRFDSCVGGIGGCPFAPKAVGNVCTEDLVFLFRDLGAVGDIDLDALVALARWLEVQLDHTLPGMLMKL